MVAPPLMAWFHIEGWEDAVRYVIAMEGFVLVGVNIALILHAPMIFARSVCRFWRIVLTGKTLVTITLALILLSRGGSLSWRAPLAAAGFTVTLVAIALLYLNRPFRPRTLDEILPASDTTEIVAARARE